MADIITGPGWYVREDGTAVEILGPHPHGGWTWRFDFGPCEWSQYGSDGRLSSDRIVRGNIVRRLVAETNGGMPCWSCHDSC